MHIQLNESKQLSKANLNKLKERMEKKNVVMLLHANWCFWCKQFKPEWDKLAANLKENNKISVAELEEAQLSALKQKDENLFNQLVGNEGLGFPTVLLFKGGDRFTYKGQRTSEDLQKHLDSFLGTEPRKSRKPRQSQKGGSAEAKGMKSLDAAINMIIKKHFGGSS